VLLAITAWGDRWTAGEAGPPALPRHRIRGRLTHAEPHCAQCGGGLHARAVDVDVDAEAGPGTRRFARALSRARTPKITMTIPSTQERAPADAVPGL
jgi:hypothetical protein